MNMIDNISHIIVVDNAGDNSCLECHLRWICDGCDLGINEHFEYENR